VLLTVVKETKRSPAAAAVAAGEARYSPATAGPCPLALLICRRFHPSVASYHSSWMLSLASR
jgi:hypothetical protein